MGPRSLKQSAALLLILTLASSVGKSSGFYLEGISGGWAFANPFFGLPALVDAYGNLYAYNGIVSVGTVNIEDVETAYAQVGLNFYAWTQVYLYQGTSTTVLLSARPFYNPAAVVTVAQTTSFSASSVYTLGYYLGIPGFDSLAG